MNGINKAIVIGALGQDPVYTALPSGVGVINMSVATNEKWTDKAGQPQEHTEWHRIVAYGKLADNCQKSLKKSNRVYVEGRIHTRDYMKDNVKHYVHEIIANNVTFLERLPTNGVISAPPEQVPPGGSVPEEN
jgi:single-strand DNA-binding protein